MGYAIIVTKHGRTIMTRQPVAQRLALSGSSLLAASHVASATLPHQHQIRGGGGSFVCSCGYKISMVPEDRETKT